MINLREVIKVKNMNCSCLYCSNNQYHVDIAAFQNKRLNGISGILRVKNDAEFLAEAIDSCIDALDELIIVYNDCSDESPQIIKEKALQYSKIKYYEYKPKIFANNLTKEEYQFIKEQPIESPHLLSNYYNFALSKVSYEYVMKIDADQIYQTEYLTEICNAYRATKKVFINPWKLLCFIYFYMSLVLYKKTNRTFLLPHNRFFKYYKECLMALVHNFKIPFFLSGYNVVYYNEDWYVSLGQKNEGALNILPPYNGITDHLIFRLSSQTYFLPIEMEEYAQLNSHKYSLIEVLHGPKIVFPYGFIWIHLNGMRRNIYRKQVANLLRYPNRFVVFDAFVRMKSKEISYTSDSIIFPLQNRLLYSVLHDNTDGKIMREYIQKFSIDKTKPAFYLVKSKV